MFKQDEMQTQTLISLEQVLDVRGGGEGCSGFTGITVEVLYPEDFQCCQELEKNSLSLVLILWGDRMD